jgi:MYXO-CTERM domain-containing protein
MRRHLFCVLMALGLLLGPAARANPVSSQVLRLRQVPKTTHVQVTYGTMHNDLPTEVTRDGTALKVSWTKLASFSANTGSGVTSIAAQQFCDCNVALGNHTYTLKLSQGYMGTLTGTISVVQNYELPPPTDMGVGKDLMPWDEPEPTALQGLDCTKACAAPTGDGPQPKADGPQPKADGPQPKADGPQVKADAGPPILNPPKEDDGCSTGGQPAGTNLLLLGAALLLGCLLVRRRAR